MVARNSPAICRTSQRPRPPPGRTQDGVFPWMKAACSWSIPGPESATSMRRHPGSVRTWRLTEPRSAAACIALSTRLRAICLMGAAGRPRESTAPTVHDKSRFLPRISGATRIRRSSRSCDSRARKFRSGRCVSSMARTMSRIPLNPRSRRSIAFRWRVGEPGLRSMWRVVNNPPSGLLISWATPAANRPRLAKRSSAAIRPSSACRSRKAFAMRL